MQVSNQDARTAFGSMLLNNSLSESQQSKLERQNNADQSAKTDRSEQNNPASDKPFLEQVREQLLANRVGLDKKEIEEMQQEIEALQALDNTTAEQSEKLELLQERLEELVQQAAERTAKSEVTQHSVEAKLNQYQSVSLMSG
ncbi:hypothetical protein [Lacimicrobium alkaliphilum]|uniref:Uncharacterized protein n=1 Tax=Lacimicrobium alkaliphilum TaxID=1526571 RepID=A0A0U2ZN31_9ALTE|nr:hypothetical protein [Lacimicrobium alkaliphilum]ALS99692.1 hypothetical protein AT746_16415 [Lacimicrobium alkaliphilum]